MAEFNIEINTKGVCTLFLMDCDVDRLDRVYQLYTFRLVNAFKIALLQSTLWMARSSKLLLKLDTVGALELEERVA